MIFPLTIGSWFAVLLTGAIYSIQIADTPHAATPSSQQARDGDFEEPAITLPWVRYAPGSHIGPWEVASSPVNLSAGSQAAEGRQAVDLGATHGEIWQDISSVSGHRYSIAFSMAGNVEGKIPIKSMQVWWDGKLLDTVHFDTSGHRLDEMGWRRFQYEVTALDSSSRLRFVSDTDEVWGPAVDDVSVKELGS